MKEYFSLFLFLLTLQITPAVATHESVRLSGHIPNKALENAVFLDTLDIDTNVSITFTLPLRNQKTLEKLVQSIYDPTNKVHYGKYLTSEEFIEQFSPTEKDYNDVIDYAKTMGFTISGTHPNRTLLHVTGPSKSIEEAFDLHLHLYQKINGQTFHAPSDNPKIPHAIASIIGGIVGLDNHAIYHPFHRRKESRELAQASNATSHTFPSGPGGGYSPSDLLTAYGLSNVLATGSNQAIALFELAKYQVSDINEYTNHFGLPNPKLQNILVDGGSQSGIDPEVTLDIELALALAPESTIYVYEGPNSYQGVLDTYNRIATDNLAKQVSTSWGLGEDSVSAQYLQAENAIFLQMAAHGQTIYAAAGDSGAYDDYPNNSSPVVDDPASQPYVVGVGGTRLTVNPETCAYTSESVWNNGFGNGAGGGGVSTFWPIPSWQASVSSSYSKTHRNVPDVSLNADTNTGYSIYHNGQWEIYGGTSCAAPLWAAFTALVNEKRTTDQHSVLGFANPLFYSIASGSSYTTDFHDITSGNNLYYSANTNYDNASGWGSFNGVNLFQTLTNSSITPPPLPTPINLLPKLNITINTIPPSKKQRIVTYEIVVSNNGNLATSGQVNASITIPNNLTYQSFTGLGWTFNKNTLTFSRNNSLNPGSSYPPIILKMNIKRNSPSSVTTTATVSGGGSISNTITNQTTIK